MSCIIDTSHVPISRELSTFSITAFAYYVHDLLGRLQSVCNLINLHLVPSFAIDIFGDKHVRRARCVSLISVSSQTFQPRLQLS